MNFIFNVFKKFFLGCILNRIKFENSSRILIPKCFSKSLGKDVISIIMEYIPWCEVCNKKEGIIFKGMVSRCCYCYPHNYIAYKGIFCSYKCLRVSWKEYKEYSSFNSENRKLFYAFLKASCQKCNKCYLSGYVRTIDKFKKVNIHKNEFLHNIS